MSKLAVQVALETADRSTPDFLVFCSQHGDMTRLREMLRSIAAGAELSPTAVSQSVHNASAGLFTIITESSAPMISLASGGSTFASGWLEAEGFLVEHPEAQVRLVAYDEPLPPEYAAFSTQTQCQYALGLLLRSGIERGFALDSGPADQEEPLPLAPLFIAWASSERSPTLRVTADGQGWVWSRLAA